MVELAGGLGDARPELLAESRDARHHLVEVLGEHTELVGGRHRDRGGRSVVRGRGDRVHEAPDRAVHDELDGAGHQDAHQHQRRAGEGERPELDPSDQLVGALRGELHGDRSRHRALERDRGHHLPVVLSPSADGSRDDPTALHVFGVAPVERQLASRLVRRDERHPVRVEGEDVELEHAGTNLEQAHDELVERRTAFELAAAPDGGRHLTRVDDRAILQILLDRAPGEAEADPGEPRGDGEDDQGAEEGELVADAEAQTAPRPSAYGDDQALSAAAVERRGIGDHSPGR